MAHALIRASDADRRLRLATAERLGVGASDLDALLLVDTAGPLTAGRIAEAMAVTTGAVTGLIDRLERAGWVQRTRHEADRRQVLIELVPERREAIANHWRERERMVLAAAGDVDDATLAACARFLDGVADRMAEGSAQRPDADEGARADGGDDHDRAPLGSVERGRLQFSAGASRLSLRGARIKDLYRATFRGRRPTIAVEADGTVGVKYKGFSWFGVRDVGAELTLTTAVPWAVEIRRGVSHLAADLRELHVSAFEITGGVSESELSLPRPRGTATVRITGGASKLSVRRPRGTAVQIVVRGGASNVTFDAQRLGAVGSATRLATPGWDNAPDRWSIELTGGASELSVTEA
ncbi:MAG TPA: MarR family transcriptional regulator [Kofleriaceae bacterium]|nr:MarR family transcriptional regulator [Kofleriaceae bacterium]